jgi:hypothetical protein
VCLSLTGREGVKPFIMAEIGGHLTSKLLVSIGPILHKAADDT